MLNLKDKMRILGIFTSVMIALMFAMLSALKLIDELGAEASSAAIPIIIITYIGIGSVALWVLFAPLQIRRYS